MKVKKTILLCMILCGYFTVSAHAHECKLLRVAGADEWMPVAYINQTTKIPEGIGYDIVKMIGKQLHIPIQYNSTLPWKRMLLYLEHGNIDINVGMYKTIQREKIYQYSIAYFNNSARVFVIKGKEFTFEKLHDLIGYIGGIPAGGSFGEAFDTFAKIHNLKLEKVKSKKQQIGMLLRGRTDYIINDYIDNLSYLTLNNLQDTIVALPHPVSTTKVYFSVSRQSPCIQLMPQINKIINQAKQDGTLEMIINKYINNTDIVTINR